MGLANLPQIRTIVGAIGNSIDEIRQFLQSVKNVKLLSGTEVSITFTLTDVMSGASKRLTTGLGYAPTGYFIIRGHMNFDIIQKTLPATETDRTVLYLSASAPGTYTLWVF